MTLGLHALQSDVCHGGAFPSDWNIGMGLLRALGEMFPHKQV